MNGDGRRPMQRQKTTNEQPKMNKNKAWNPFPWQWDVFATLPPLEERRCRWTGDFQKAQSAFSARNDSFIFHKVAPKPEKKLRMLSGVLPKLKTQLCMHGRWKGETRPSWIMKFDICGKKDCFLSFEWIKWNFTAFGPLWNVFLVIPGKNSSDAQVCMYVHCTIWVTWKNPDLKRLRSPPSRHVLWNATRLIQVPQATW